MHKSTLLLFTALLLRTTLPAQCWQKINAGGNQSFAIATDGTLWGWGRNNSSQLAKNN